MKNNYQNIISRIKKTRKMEILYQFLNGLVITIGISSLVFLIISALELVANFNIAVRTVLFYIFVFSTVSSFAYFSLNHLLKLFGLIRDEKFEATAIRIGAYFPEIRDKLSNALQLYPMIAEPNGNSPELTKAAFETISSETQKYDFKKILDTKRVKNNILKSSVPVLLLILLFIFLPGSFGNASYRIINYNSSFIPPAPFTINIEQKQFEIIRGEDINIDIFTTGNPPESIELHLKEEIQKEYDVISLKLDSNKYSYTIPSAKNSISFFAKANWMGTAITTETGKFTVIEIPIIRTISGVLSYPQYTGIPQRRFTEKDADLSALKGSTVKLNISTNKELKKASLIYSYEDIQETDSLEILRKNDTLNFNIDNNNPLNADITFRIKNSGKYYIKVWDEKGKDNKSPIEYGILALTDNYPSISLISPLSDVQLNKDALLPINVQINDDFGFNNLKLYYKLTESKYVQPDKDYSSIDLTIPEDKISANIYHIWNLNELDITPEDKYEFYLEVADNDIISGPKTARTSTLSVRLPSIEEIMSSSDTQQKNIEKNLEELMSEAEELSKDISEFNREMNKKDKKEELNWEERKKAEDIVKKQEELRDKFDDLRSELQETTEKLQQNNMLSEETLRKYEELQRLMQEVNSPEMQRMQQRMQEAMDKMSAEEMQKAMQEVQFNEDEFRKSIDRTKKILERMKAEQKIDALQKLAEEMVQEQENIMNEAENMDAGDEQKAENLKNRQDDLSEKLDFIENELNNLESLMKSLEDDTLPMEQLSEAQESLQKEETQSEMQNANQQMDNNKQEAQESRQNAKNNLQEFSEQMQQLKNQMEQMSSQQAIQQMQKSINDLLELSKQQENVKNQSANSSYNSTKIPEIAKEQSKLSENLNNVAMDMSDLSEKSFAITAEMGKDITNAMQQMGESMQQMADRRMNNAANAQSGAMESLNSAISQMQQMLAAMQEQGNGTCPNPGGQGQGQGQGQGSQMSFSQQMQQMAARQQMLNQAMQQGMSEGMGGGMSQEQRAEMGRLSEEQGQAQSSLEELAEQEDEFADRDKSQSRELRDIAKEMEEVIRDMNNNNISERTLKRQERILSRLLDATKSVHERDFEKKRESKEGKYFDMDNPDMLDFEDEKLKQAINDLLNKNRLKYSKDYEILIKNYFNLIQENQNNSRR